MNRILWALGYIGAGLSAANAAWYGLSQSDPGLSAWLSAAVMAFIAIVAVHALAVSAKVWKSGYRVGSVAMGLGFIVCFVVTLAGGMGTIVTRATSTEAGRVDAATRYGDDRAEQTRLLQERAALGSVRPVGAVDAEIASLKHDRRWASSNQCSDATATASREFCSTFVLLQGERAASLTAERINGQVATLAARLQSAGADVHRSGNEHAAALAVLLGLSAPVAAALYAFAVSLALELGAMLVMLAAELTGSSEPKTVAVNVDRSSTAESVAAPIIASSVPKPVAVQQTPALTDGRSVARIDLFALDQLKATAETAALDVAVAHTRYCRWADGRGERAMDRRDFESLFVALCVAVGHPIERRGRKVYALGLKAA